MSYLGVLELLIPLLLLIGVVMLIVRARGRSKRQAMYQQQPPYPPSYPQQGYPQAYPQQGYQQPYPPQQPPQQWQGGPYGQ